MRIYVANLAAYVSGRLIGEWLDLDDYSDADELREAIQAKVIAPHGGEEWAIHDHEGFGDWTIGEYTSLDLIWTFNEAVAAYPGDEEDVVTAMGAWISHNGSNYAEESIESFQDAYQGNWESGAAYAEEFAAEQFAAQGEGEETPSYWPYIDWERYWHGEFECAGWFISDGHVFDGNAV